MKISEMKLKKARSVLLAITPDISALLEDFNKINEMRLNGENIEESQAVGAGVQIVKEFIEMLVNRQYDALVRILSALYETTTDEMENKPIIEIYSMIENSLKDEMLMRFFPQLWRLNHETP